MFRVGLEVAEQVGRVSGAETKKGCVLGWVMRNWSGVVEGVGRVSGAGQKQGYGSGRKMWNGSGGRVSGTGRASEGIRAERRRNKL